MLSPNSIVAMTLAISLGMNPYIVASSFMSWSKLKFLLCSVVLFLVGRKTKDRKGMSMQFCESKIKERQWSVIPWSKECMR